MTGHPHHIGFIMDGNRRFAKRLMLHPTKGHEWGAKKVWKVFEWCKQTNVGEMTFYTFSTENFDRPKPEINYLMKLFSGEIKALIKDQRLSKEGICIRFIGRTTMFPPSLQLHMQTIADMTRKHKKIIMNFAMGYGGRCEIVDAARRIAQEVQQGILDVNTIDEKTVSDHLYLSSEPDLIIRTGGEHRTSNFLPFQSAYSEWIFLDKYWPEFEKEDFKACIKEFKRRERRRGR